MRKIVFIFILLAGNIFSQTHHTFNESDWLGTWKGTLLILYPSKVQEVEMKLEIAKTDTPDKYSWKTTYGEDSKILTKDYFIYPTDKDKGNWILDEDNSILLDFYFTNNSFYSIFEVQKTLLTSTYKLENGKLYFEIMSVKSDTPKITGKKDDKGNEVLSYPVYVVQKSELTK